MIVANDMKEATWVASGIVRDPRHKVWVSLTEQEEARNCAWCGESLGEDSSVENGLPICFDCLGCEVSKGLERRWSPEQEPLPPEHRFDALFGAARVLLREGIGEEDRVFPTVACANGLGEGYIDLSDAKERLLVAKQSPEDWEIEADMFVQACPKFRPVDIVDGVLILERLPVSVELINYMHPEIVMPKMVTLEVSPGQRMAKPEHVAALYEKALSTAGIPCTEGTRGTINFEFTGRFGYRLYIRVKHGLEDLDVEHLALFCPTGKLNFPHPLVVQRFYEMVMGRPGDHGFARYLVGRSRGRVPDVDTIVPACVGAYLRRFGKISSRKEVHRLLNTHVLSGTWKTLPEEGYGSSVVNQLWRDVKKVEAWILHDHFALFS